MPVTLFKGASSAPPEKQAFHTAINAADFQMITADSMRYEIPVPDELTGWAGVCVHVWFDDIVSTNATLFDVGCGFIRKIRGKFMTVSEHLVNDPGSSSANSKNTGFQINFKFYVDKLRTDSITTMVSQSPDIDIADTDTYRELASSYYQDMDGAFNGLIKDDVCVITLSVEAGHGAGIANLGGDIVFVPILS